MPRLSSLFVLVAALCLSGYGCAQAQTQPTNFPDQVDQPPTSIPEGCSVALVTAMHVLTGTDTYRSTRREIAALELGHKGTQQVLAAIKNDPKATHFHNLVARDTGLTDARNTYLCASFLLGQEMPSDDQRKKITVTLIASNNMMALGVWQLQKQFQKMEQDNETSVTTSEAQTAEAVAVLIQDRKNEVSVIAEATAVTAALLLKLDDPKATVVDTLKITCSEKQSLLTAIAALTKATPADDFTRDAVILQGELKKPYRCGLGDER